MPKSSPQAVILAAGESSRFWPLNHKHKSLTQIMGEPLISHTIKSLKSKEINNTIIIQGPDRAIEDKLGKQPGIGYIIQPKPDGMGDAVIRAQNFDSILVFHAHKVDAGNYIEKLRRAGAGLVFLGAKTNQPQFYGMLELDGNRVKGVTEKPKEGKEPSNIRIVGGYLLPPNFSEYYKRAPQNHYAFEDALNLYAKENEARLVMVKEDNSSLKYPWQLFEMTRYLLDSRLKGQEIHPTAKIASNVIIEGNVHIGENTKVFEGAVIKGPCFIGPNCVIGNHVLVRDYSNLEEGVVIGAHAEVSRCIFQKNTHVHSGYLGDSIFGENCRVGAGTITANVRLDRREIKVNIKGEEIGTGLVSLGVIVGDNTNIGINVSLMPGVLIGSNCAVGPSSVVFENIEDNSVFYTKFAGTIDKKR